MAQHYTARRLMGSGWLGRTSLRIGGRTLFAATKGLSMQFEDWMFHVLLPCIGYAILLGSAAVALAHEREALFGAAAAALMLLFIGIHNAWDSIAYHVFTMRDERSKK